jgi:hypothetical protein
VNLREPPGRAQQLPIVATPAHLWDANANVAEQQLVQLGLDVQLRVFVLHAFQLDGDLLVRARVTMFSFSAMKMSPKAEGAAANFPDKGKAAPDPVPSSTGGRRLFFFVATKIRSTKPKLEVFN